MTSEPETSHNATGHVSEYLVEAAAQALYEVRYVYRRSGDVPPWDERTDEEKREHRGDARKILEAAPTPDDSEWHVFRAVVMSTAKTWHAAQHQLSRSYARQARPLNATVEIQVDGTERINAATEAAKRLAGALREVRGLLA